MPWKLFLTEPSEFCRRSFRRYAGGVACPAHPIKYHNAEVVVDAEIRAVPAGEGGRIVGDQVKSDPRWPASCACGYAFLPDDSWQINTNRLYRGSPDGRLHTIRDFPPGAMWDAFWLAESGDRYVGPDRKAWCVMMPGGMEWIVYGPSSDGKKWNIEGKPPDITVSPSIHLTGIFHGHIKKGLISEDVNGRKFAGVPRTA